MRIPPLNKPAWPLVTATALLSLGMELTAWAWKHLSAQALAYQLGGWAIATGVAVATLELLARRRD